MYRYSTLPTFTLKSEKVKPFILILTVPVESLKSVDNFRVHNLKLSEVHVMMFFSMTSELLDRSLANVALKPTHVHRIV